MTGHRPNATVRREAILVRIRIGDGVETLSWEEWEARVRSGRIHAGTEVQFEPVTGDAYERAGDLEMYRSLRGEERQAWQTGLATATVPLLTALLVGIQVRLWWFGGGLWGTTGFPEIELLQVSWGIRETSAIFEDGESWRMLTMGFLHTDPLHIASNTVFLAFAAYNLERTIGRANLAVLYVAAVIGGSVLSCAFGPETPSLGASGGVYGLIAAMVTVAFARPTLLGSR
ncbi:MAG: rhomboid family intramembrane serine protease, partial [Myxococcota bacterium]